MAPRLTQAAMGRQRLGPAGGSRVIYYFHNLDVPLFPMAIFAKNVQADLTPKQKSALIRQLSAIRMELKGKKRK